MGHSIFAMELCFRMDQGVHLQQQLLAALPVQSQSIGVGAKWQSYRQLMQLLHSNIYFAEAGCWDYFDDPERAAKDFEMWRGGMTSAEGARPEPRGFTPNEPRYLTFTMAFLLVKDSPSDLVLRGCCDVPEAALWQRATFARILSQFGQVSFASVFSDVAYLIPREWPWALTAQDLAEPKFHYLRRLA
jgi:hypothetical protein